MKDRDGKNFGQVRNKAVSLRKKLNPMQKLKDDNKHLLATLEDLLKSNHYLQQDLKNLKNDLTQQAEHVQNNDTRINEVIHRLSAIRSAPASSSGSSNLLADNHSLDGFYVEFENHFRGSEETIKKRLEVHLPRFKKIAKDTAKYPVLDIGCGRGEFISLMKENDITCIGLDLNKAMVDRVKERGVDAFNIDALSFLRKQKSNSLTAITGFHIVEHIPFADLYEIFNECYRVLRPGGFTLFETPNPETLTVGSHSFYMDPSHLNPVPPQLLDFAMKSCGFSKREVIRLHPHTEAPANASKATKLLFETVFGAQDYAVIAEK